MRLHATTSQPYAALERAGPFDVDPLMSLTLLSASLSLLTLLPLSLVLRPRLLSPSARLFIYASIPSLTLSEHPFVSVLR